MLKTLVSWGCSFKEEVTPYIIGGALCVLIPYLFFKLLIWLQTGGF
jgi:hypothetical protein